MTSPAQDPEPPEFRSSATPGQPELRASDADREQVVTRLRDAAAEGRIDLTELEERLDRALAAKTYGELAPLTADLPAPADALKRPPRRQRSEPLVIRGGFAGLNRDGVWDVPPRTVVHGDLGGVKLDFTQARCEWEEFEVEVHAGAGGVTLVVPPGMAVDTEHVNPDLGGLTDKSARGEPQPGQPVLRVTGSGSLGGIKIRHRNRWERLRAPQSSD